MRRFLQHAFGSVVKLNYRTIPSVLITPKALHKMQHYVNLSTGEVGWLGLVREIDRDYLVEDVFLVEQEVSTATTEMKPEGIAKLGSELLARENGVDLCNRLKFWGHSHGHGGTISSGQDESQMATFLDDTTEKYPFFVRAIANKSGRMQFTIYMDMGGMVIEDAEWGIYYPVNDGMEDSIKEELRIKVSALMPVHVSYGYPYYNKWDKRNKNANNGSKKRLADGKSNKVDYLNPSSRDIDEARAELDREMEIQGGDDNYDCY